MHTLADMCCNANFVPLLGMQAQTRVMRTFLLVWKPLHVQCNTHHLWAALVSAVACGTIMHVHAA